MAIDPKHLKRRKVIIYGRNSLKEAGADPDRKMDAQVGTITTWLKENGIKGKPQVFTEVASGTDPTRTQWAAAVAATLAHPGKAALYVRDLQRASRDMRQGMAQSIPLYENDIPIVAILDNMQTGTKVHPSPDDDLLMGIKISMGGAEVEMTKKRVRATAEELKKAGIATTAGPSLYPFAPENPWDIMRELEPRLDAGTITASDYGFDIEVRSNIAGTRDATKNKAATHVGPKSTWWRRRLPVMKRIRAEADFSKWWAFMERVRAFEQAEGYDGVGKGTRKGKVSYPVKALRRMTAAYMNEPWNYPKPTNAEWAKWISDPAAYVGATDVKAARAAGY